MIAIKSFIYYELVFFAVMLVGMFGQKFQLLPFKLAFGGFALGLLLAAVLGVVSLIAFALSFGIISSEARMHSLVSFGLGFIPLIMVLVIVGAGLKVPKIHDISTDLDDNLEFENAMLLRLPSENSLSLPSERAKELHRSHYKNMQSLMVSEAPSEAYAKALRIASELGWIVRFQNDESTTFEATESTTLFGFVDDIVVRVEAAEDSAEPGRKEGSKIDMRSVSRVGQSDLGANAKRIGLFQEAFKAI